jgi:hypothetical protein
MPPVGLELTISAGERPKTYALDRAATGTGFLEMCLFNKVQEGDTKVIRIVDQFLPDSKASYPTIHYSLRHQ